MSVTKRIVWENFATGASGDIEIERAFLRRMGEMYDTFCRKQRDYGRGNIAKFGENGVLVRVSDKVERLINLSNRADAPMNESVDDSWLDVATYGVIGMICRRGEWGSTPSLAGVEIAAPPAPDVAASDEIPF